MGDSFSIERVGTFKNFDITMSEVSDVSNIIKNMILIKNDRTRVIKKQTLAYNVEDKIKLNCISTNLAQIITKHHIEAYDIVEEAINSMEEFEACLREDLYDYYWQTYITTLIDLEVEFNDLTSIKEKSDLIYKLVNKNIKVELFEGKQSTIPENKIETYISAITAFVFYKCKFLIPLE